jgi:5,10-methenyltetrahydrofolate synthetase
MDATINDWRRATRTALLERRQAVPPAERRQAAEAIAERLDHLCAKVRPACVGLYWPIKHEFSLLDWGRALAQAGGVRLCLPVVVTPKAPLEYWEWTPGEKMTPGFWNIPQPGERRLAVPELVLAPVLGFDRARYRLGYGGGYFDRTLAALPRRPFAVGVGYAFGALETIFPQPHDVPMDAVVTEGVVLGAPA